VHTRARVERIAAAGGRIRGVSLADGRHLAADAVVMNGDAATAGRLLGSTPAATVPLKDRSLAGLVLLAGLKRRLPVAPHHAVYFSADYAREFDDLFRARRFPSEPTVYVNVPSRSDRSVVPDGQGEALFIMANAPAVGSDWTDGDTAEATRRIFARLARGGFPEIESDCAVRDAWTPRRLEDEYSAPGGAIYGTHSHGWRQAFLRPPNRDRRVRGLYYVGGSTHPGGGTPTVLMSARITAALIEEDA
jgi:phytoene dehydrogenase-like protein